MLPVLKTLTRELFLVVVGAPRLSSTCWVTVLVQDVNDHTPVFPHFHYTARVLENEVPPTNVLKVSAMDADEGTNAKLL